MERTDRIVNLLKKYTLQDISSDELAELQIWCKRDPEYAALLSELSDHRKLEEAYQQYKKLEVSEQLSYEAIWQKIQASPPLVSNGHKVGFKKWLSIAAMLLIVGTGTWIVGKRYLFQQKQQEILALSLVPDTTGILPGRTKAQLVLNTGKKIDLGDDIAGIEVDAGKLSYVNGNSRRELSLADATMHTLIVPKGGEFKMKLPDGTLVWLNAFSSLKFPSRFSGDKREVELIGEAYFEVSKNEKQPFIVKSWQQDVRVLGTSFNIKAYQDDNATTTTLVDGKVIVSSSNGAGNVILLPGEESGVNQYQLSKYKADLDKALSWQRGEFVFNRTSVDEVMKQIARWYMVEVEYTHGIPDEYFTGQLNRSVDFEVVLRFLKESGINYHIQARKITIL